MIPYPRLVATGRVLLVLLLPGLVACADDLPPAGPGGEDPAEGPLARCDLVSRYVVDTGLGPGGIPSLDHPTFVPPGSPGLEYLGPDDRVLGFTVAGQAYAVPHNILWWHEIVNTEIDGRRLSLTYAPLTGSSRGFDRVTVAGAQLEHSGYLYRANMVMHDGGAPGSFWPQMLGEARCGEPSGTELARWPVVEMEWGSWSALHPGTLAVSSDTGFDRSYELYPYGDYERLTNPDFLGNPMPDLDPRRPPKERVLGLPPAGGDAAIALPHGELEELEGPVAVVRLTRTGEEVVVLWSDDAAGGMAFRPRTRGGVEVSLVADGDAIVDQETGSRWTVDGRAVEGERAGEALVPIPSAFTAFWGAWSAFFSQTLLWEAQT